MWALLLNIQFTAPSDLKVGINRTQTINALDYATDSGYTITCGTATSIDSTKLTSVVRDCFWQWLRLYDYSD